MTFEGAMCKKMLGRCCNGEQYGDERGDGGGV